MSEETNYREISLVELADISEELWEKYHSSSIEKKDKSEVKKKYNEVVEIYNQRAKFKCLQKIW